MRTCSFNYFQSLLLLLSSTSKATLLTPYDSFASEFFVCESGVPNMDGRYIRQSLEVTQSDLDTPVYARLENEDVDDETEFQLFRHNGIWMFADVAPWPPESTFRCDPTRELEATDAVRACKLDLDMPPRYGYTAVRATSTPHISLSTTPCDRLSSNKSEWAHHDEV